MQSKHISIIGVVMTAQHEGTEHTMIVLCGSDTDAAQVAERMQKGQFVCPSIWAFQNLLARTTSPTVSVEKFVRGNTLAECRQQINECLEHSKAGVIDATGVLF